MKRVFISLISMLIIPMCLIMILRVSNGKNAYFDLDKSISYFANLNWSQKFENNLSETREIFTHISNNEVIVGKEKVYKEYDRFNYDTLMWYKDKIYIGDDYKWEKAINLSWWDSFTHGTNTFFVTSLKVTSCLSNIFVDLATNLGIVIGWFNYVINI